MQTYAQIGTPVADVLHGAARLHVALGRMDGSGISTRGWTYNRLVNGVVGSGWHFDATVRQKRGLDVLFDTLNAICEIGEDAVAYLEIWKHK